LTGVDSISASNRPAGVSSLYISQDFPVDGRVFQKIDGLLVVSAGIIT